MINCISVGFMRTKIGLLIGLGTALLLFLSTYGISTVYGQQTDLKDSSIDNKTGNSNSGSQTDLDPFMSRGSDGNTNTGNGDDASLTDDGSGSTKNDDGSGRLKMMMDRLPMMMDRLPMMMDRLPMMMILTKANLNRTKTQNLVTMTNINYHSHKFLYLRI